MKEIDIKDVFEWDVHNWSKSLEIWKPHLLSDRRLKCLEIGSRRGGISLLLTSYNHNVLCSDLENPAVQATRLHDKYGVTDQVRYAAVDLMNLNFKNEFDLIVFKSVLGGVARNNDIEKACHISKQLYMALKPGGKILFAENCEGSFLHKFLRRNLRRWGDSWSYFSAENYRTIFSNFDSLEINTYGFWAAFALGPKSRAILTAFDKAFSGLISARNKYIIYGVAQKKY